MYYFYRPTKQNVMKRYHFIFALIIASVMAFSSCRQEEPESYIAGDWRCTSTKVSYNGASYTTTSDFVLVNDKPIPAPYSLTVNVGGTAIMDGYDRGTFTYSHSEKEGEFKFPSRDYKMTIPYGILLLSFDISDVTSVVVNSKKLQGGDKVTLTYWFEQ